ncbi:MAG: hypothetical protein QXY40_06660 [Candidatus Methanomethylicia archaeon]
MRMLFKRVFEMSDLELLNENIKFNLNQNLPQIEICGEKIGPFSQGATIELPRWVCDKLEEQGYGSKIEDIPSIVWISKLAWSESRSQAIMPLEPLFYAKLRRMIKTLKQRASQSSDPATHKDYEVVYMYSLDLITSRLQKIVKASLMAPGKLEAIPNTTDEEKFLFIILSKLVNSWSRAILEVE